MCVNCAVAPTLHLADVIERRGARGSGGSQRCVGGKTPLLCVAVLCAVLRNAGPDAASASTADAVRENRRMLITAPRIVTVVMTAGSDVMIASSLFAAAAEGEGAG